MSSNPTARHVPYARAPGDQPGWLTTLVVSPGFVLRLLIPIYLVVDRILNVGREREIVISSVNDLDPYAQFQVGVTLLCAAFVVQQLMTRMAIALRRLNFETPLIFLVGYLGLACLSSLWSTSDLLTLFKAGQCLVFFLAIQCALVGLPDIVERLRYVMIVALTYLAASYFTFFAYDVPELGLSISTLHFVVGAVPFFGFIFLARLRETGVLGRVFQGIILLVSLIETVFTIYLAFIAAEFTNFLLKHRHIGQFAATVIAVAMLAAFVLLLPTSDEATVLGVKSVEHIASGSGRFEVWEYALSVGFPEHPVVGHGFVVGDSIARDRGINQALGQLHNSVLSSLLNLGLVGFGLFAMLMIGIFRMIVRHPRDNVRRLSIACMVCVVFQQLAGGASVSSMLHPVWISHAMFFVMIAIEELTVTRPTLRLRAG